MNEWVTGDYSNFVHGARLDTDDTVCPTDEEKWDDYLVPASAGLVRAAQRGDRGSISELLHHSTHFIERQAYKFARTNVGREREDLMQEGSIALWQAIAKFDPTKGASFETFAFRRIRNAMIDYIWKHERVVSLPRDTCRVLALINIQITRFQAQFYRTPTKEEIAKETGISLQKIQTALAREREFQPACLDQFIEEAGDNQDWEPDSGAARNRLFELQIEYHELIRPLLGMLTQREREVLLYRYGLCDGIVRTRRQVANLIGVSTTRVTEIESNVICKLRRYLTRDR